MEEWKQIPSFPDYAASSLGNIKRVAPKHNGPGGNILKLTEAKNGYLYCAPNAIKRMTHCLVAEAFLGPRPDGCVINHKDFDIKNNKVDNLEYCTQAKNLEYSRNAGRDTRGEKHGNCLYTKEQVIKMRQMYKEGVRQVDIAKELEISNKVVNRIVKYKGWKWLQV